MKQAEKQFEDANEFVQRRRRTKIKLFFQGLFTALGSIGGKFMAALGFGVGTVVGGKAADAATFTK